MPAGHPHLEAIGTEIAARIDARDDMRRDLSVYYYPADKLQVPCLNLWADLPHMLDTDNDDTRTFCGAPRTLRWAGMLAIAIKDTEDLYTTMLEWAHVVADVFESEPPLAPDASLTLVDGPARAQADHGQQYLLLEFLFTTTR